MEETILDQALPKSTEQNLATVTQGCHSVLEALQALVQKYESLGTQSRRTFDRMKWGAHDIAELRARLTRNTVLPTAFTRYIFFTQASSSANTRLSCSQVVV